MPIYEFNKNTINRLEETSFGSVGLLERKDLQRLLREHIEVIAPDALVISEEFGDWEDSKRRIDLLCIDKDANFVVVELKRTEDGGHMELQAIRYASMISNLTFEHAVNIFETYLKRLGREQSDARTAILDFLGWDEPDEDQFGQDVRIILASAEFSKELASSVLWLLDHEIDIRCIRLKPYKLDEYILVDVQPIIPLPEAADYQFQLRAKVRKEREARASNADFTRFDVHVGDQLQPSMWKRNAIYLVCKYLCDHQIDPAEIAALFREANGARSAQEMRARIARYRRTDPHDRSDFEIGCRILTQPFFFEESDWISVPTSWSRNIVSFKTYNTDDAEGLALWEAVNGRFSRLPFAGMLEDQRARYGEPHLIRPRLGQGAFRVLVTDIYQRRCAVTQERVLPALEAAHIRPYGDGGTHEAPNGLLLRRDIHSLFDAGYVTVTPDLRFEVSRHIKEDFDNGKHYYALHGQMISMPVRAEQRPAPAALSWHNKNCYRG